MGYVTKIAPPAEFDAAERAAFDHLVRTEGEVADGVLQRMNDAAVLVTLTEGGVLIGTGAIKIPDAGYRGGVFRKAGVIHRPASFPNEFGWVVVAKSHRGNRLSGVITDAALGAIAGAPVYATSRAANERMHASLTRRGFERVGRTYPSTQHPGEEIALFVRP